MSAPHDEARAILAELHEDMTDQERDAMRAAMEDLYDVNGLPQ